MLGTRHALALASALFLLSTVARADDPYADFRVPDHRSFSWIVQSDGATLLHARNQGAETDRDRSATGSVRSRTAWTSESEARQHVLEFDTGALWSDDHLREAFQFPP